MSDDYDMLNAVINRARAVAKKMTPKTVGELRASLEKLRLEHVCQRPSHLYALANRSTAPVTVCEFYNDKQCTVSMFMLNKPYSTLPLHDHPGMHGFLRVLAGKVRIDVYSPIIDSVAEQQNGVTINLDDSGGDDSILIDDEIIRARCHPPLFLSAEDHQPQTLAPIECNLHALQSIQSPVIFLDVLTPSYEPRAGRDCYYYSPVSKHPDSDGVVSLRRLQQHPENYYCDCIRPSQLPQ